MTFVALLYGLVVGVISFFADIEAFIAQLLGA